MYFFLLSDEVRRKVETAKNLLVQEFESERSHHQRLVKEHARLQQRLENLQGEMEVGCRGGQWARGEVKGNWTGTWEMCVEQWTEVIGSFIVFIDL